MLALVGLGAALAMGISAAFEFLHTTTTKAAAFDIARKLSTGKGIINVGAGPHRTPQAIMIANAPEVVVNIDKNLDGMPNFTQFDVERNSLPFADKQFGCAFASHVLEHLDNWRFVLDEMVRVADYVIVVLPAPAYFSGWLNPEHKQHFSIDDMREISELYPTVAVYC